MNYELAKKLKDAGFPQVFGLEGITHQPGEMHVARPTLSELIEACNPTKGDEFGIMTRSDGLYEVQLSIYGSTPEEAVAHLWLALNKPSML